MPHSTPILLEYVQQARRGFAMRSSSYWQRGHTPGGGTLVLLPQRGQVTRISEILGQDGSVAGRA